MQCVIKCGIIEVDTVLFVTYYCILCLDLSLVTVLSVNLTLFLYFSVLYCCYNVDVKHRKFLQGEYFFAKIFACQLMYLVFRV